jgi:hypothetical protein
MLTPAEAKLKMIMPEMKLEKLFFMKYLNKIKCCKILHSLHCRNGNLATTLQLQLQLDRSLTLTSSLDSSFFLYSYSH